MCLLQGCLTAHNYAGPAHSTFSPPHFCPVQSRDRGMQHLRLSLVCEFEHRQWEEMLEVKDNFVFTHWQIRCKVRKVTAVRFNLFYVIYSIVLFHTSAFLCALSCLPQLRVGMLSKEPWNFRNCEAFWLAFEAADPEHRRICVYVTLTGKTTLYMHVVCKHHFNSGIF